MFKRINHIIFIAAILLFAACDPCRYERQIYLGNSIDVLDNSGRSPISFKGDVAEAKSFGIYIQLEFQNKHQDPDVCIYESGDVPRSFKVFTVYNFSPTYLANSEITSAFTLLNSSINYPAPLINASVREINYLLLNTLPTKDTTQQFIIYGYRDFRLVSTDTTRAIVISR